MSLHICPVSPEPPMLDNAISIKISCAGPNVYLIIWALVRENLSSGVCEQQRRRPACAYAESDQRFVVHLTESIMSRHSTSEISMFYFVSVAKQANLDITLPGRGSFVTEE